MKLALVQGERWSEGQSDIHRTFVWFALTLSRQDDVTVFLCADNAQKAYECNGWVETLERNGVRVRCNQLFRLRDYDKETKTFEDAKWDDFDFNEKFDVLILWAGVFCSKAIIGRDFSAEAEDGVYCSYLNDVFSHCLLRVVNVLRVNSHRKLHVICDFLEFKPQALQGYDFEEFAQRRIDWMDYAKTSVFEAYYFSRRRGDGKSLKCVFGYNGGNGQRRQALSRLIEEKAVDEKGFVWLANDKRRQIKNVVSQDEYLDLIEEAEFTLMASANDESEISWQRWCESVCRNCIPLVVCDGPIETMSGEYPELFEFYKKNELFYDEEETLNDFIKGLDYDALIEELNELKCVQTFRKKKRMVERIREEFKLC